MTTIRTVQCRGHGETSWAGEVICITCKTVWKLENDEHVPPVDCGTNCTCGSPLTGPDGTARAICAECYREARASKN